MQLATVLLYGFNGLDRLAANRSQRRHFEKQKTVPEQVGFRFSPALLFVVLRIYLRACEDGLRRITVLLRCDPALRVADGSCHCL